MDGDAMQVDLDDVDDLFGDGVQLGLHTRPPSKRLQQRLDELRSRGACRGIAWSKTGTIASIVPGGQSLELRYIRADPKDGTWGLSEPTPFVPWPNLAGGPIVHLSWSPMNSSSELAVVDAVGRVLIFSVGANLNRPTLIRRWDSDPVDDLHAVVGTYWLNVKPSNSAKASIRLMKLDSIVVNKIVTGVSVLSYGKIICFTYTDGSVEYRDRFTMEELYTDVNLNRINSILEVGFTQRGDHLSLQTALSPTNFSVVDILEDGKIKWYPINYTLNDPSMMTDAQLSAVVAGITAATANAVTSNSNMDDILAIARPFSHKDRFIASWVNELVRVLKIAVDYSEEAPHDQLMRNHQMQICLSILHHLGWKGEYQPREFSSKLALIMLNLRNIVILITMANNTNALRGAANPMDDPDVVNALAGCCRWTVDLLSWLCDSLFCLLNDNKFKGILTNQAQFSQLTSYLHEKNEIALHMVLCSSIRSLLGGVCRRITVLHNLSHRAISHYELNNPNTAPGAGGKGSGNSNNNGYGSPLHIAYQKVYRHTSAALINPEAFQTLLASLNREVREVYSKSFAKMAEQASKAQNQNQPQPQSQQQQQHQKNLADDAIARARQHCELQMLLGQAPPSTFQPLIAKFLYQDLAAFRDGPGNGNSSGSGAAGAGAGVIDPALLYFADYDILEVDDTPGALERRRARGARVDLFKRVEITRPHSRSRSSGGAAENGSNNIPWRRCVRCASVMEDVASAAAAAAAANGGGSGNNSNNNHKPQINFVLSQQRNCCCGGRLAWLP
ncbi:Mediator of RNA polymerase II transcription subunit 16 [Diatrype stigma]|uniref:Mediator of RNA polymerase II transcription subunit 16 n=1 Tax=Diatrype stigma TaxID=117547 RepID=A0AAN9UV31_9PEZI